jgi:hypothetical protein
MAVPNEALAAIFGLQVSVLGEKIGDLSIHGLSQQRARALPQDFGELIVKGSGLNQLERAIVGHGISLLRWRSRGVKHFDDMPPFRFAPSSTFDDSSTTAVPRRPCITTRLSLVSTVAGLTVNCSGLMPLSCTSFAKRRTNTRYVVIVPLVYRRFVRLSSKDLM